MSISAYLWFGNASYLGIWKFWGWFLVRRHGEVLGACLKHKGSYDNPSSRGYWTRQNFVLGPIQIIECPHDEDDWRGRLNST